METLLRGIGIFVGSVCAVFGAVRIYWEIKSWEVLSTLEQRAPLVNGDPRVPYRLPALVLALGLTLILVSLIA